MTDLATAIRRNALKHAEEAARVVQVGQVTDLNPITVELESGKVVVVGDELELSQQMVAYDRDTGLELHDTALVLRKTDIGGEVLWLMFDVLGDVPPAAGGGGTVVPATTTALGVSKLSTAAIDPANPIVVSDTDPRNTNARTPTAHTHAESDVTGLVSDLAGKAPVVHTHAESDVTGLVADLAGKAPTVHTHTESDVTGLVADLAAKEVKTAKGAANGYAPLDASLQVPRANLKQIGARAYRAAAQSITPSGSANIVTFDTEDWDTAAMFALASADRITIVEAGVYAIMAATNWLSNATGYRQCYILKTPAGGGADVILALDNRVATNGSATRQTVACHANLAVGDAVRMQVLQNSGGALDLSAGAPWANSLSVVRAG